MALLVFRDRYVDAILSGTKTSTLRKTQPRAHVGERLFLQTGRGASARPFAEAMIESMEQIDVEALNDEDAKVDGFDTADELRARLQQTYPDHRYLWCVRFRVVGVPERAESTT